MRPVFKSSSLNKLWVEDIVEYIELDLRFLRWCYCSESFHTMTSMSLCCGSVFIALSSLHFTCGSCAWKVTRPKVSPENFPQIASGVFFFCFHVVATIPNFCACILSHVVVFFFLHFRASTMWLLWSMVTPTSTASFIFLLADHLPNTHAWFIHTSSSSSSVQITATAPAHATADWQLMAVGEFTGYISDRAGER